MSGDYACSSSSQRMLPGTLLWKLESLHLNFLVDSAADGWFISQEVVEQAKIPRWNYTMKETILDLDGRIFVKVTHRTIPLTMIIFREPP